MSGFLQQKQLGRPSHPGKPYSTMKVNPTVFRLVTPCNHGSRPLLPDLRDINLTRHTNDKNGFAACIVPHPRTRSMAPEAIRIVLRIRSVSRTLTAQLSSNAIQGRISSPEQDLLHSRILVGDSWLISQLCDQLL